MEDLALPFSYPGEVAVQKTQPNATLGICHNPARGRHLRRWELSLDFEIANEQKTPPTIEQSLYPNTVFEVLRDSSHHPRGPTVILVDPYKFPVLINGELVVDANPELSGVIFKKGCYLTTRHGSN